MKPGQAGGLYFLDYCLDPANAELRRGTTVIALRPKALAVLGYLAARPGRLVTRSELLDAVWPETAVSEWVLTTCIKELRQALDDDPREPRAIATSHGHGYRFIAEVWDKPVVRFEVTALGDKDSPSGSVVSVVGRVTELAQLDACFQRALNGERQVVFVAGEPGIGKTALVEEFLRALVARGVGVTGGDPRNPTASSLLMARGQCIEQHGAGEPYLPVLEALAGLCAVADGESILALLRRHAPAWLLQLPGILDMAEAEALERRLGTSTRERMLREMASFVAALPMPLVWVLEDLHWSDQATLDLVSVLAERGERARLLLIGTYRPVDVVVREHPLKNIHQELRARRRCRDLWLRSLGEAEVGAYLTARWPGLDNVSALARIVHERTDGNPLFLVNVGDHLVAENAVAKADGRWILRPHATQVAVEVPTGLREIIAAQIDRLAEADGAVLESASLIGRTFSAALVAAALASDVIEVERRLARLANAGQVLRNAGASEWPDGSVAGAYAFTHFLYQTALREQVPPARQRQLHARIAMRLEAAYAGRVADVAGELAYHFENGGELDRAALYLEEAGLRAVRRGAAREAVEQLNHGLALLEPLPPTAERTLRTIRLLLALSVALPQLRGWGDAGAEQACLRARALAEQTNDQVQLAQTLGQLVAHYISQARLDRAANTADAMGELMLAMPLPAFVAGGNLLLGMVQYHAGDLTLAQDCFEQTLAVGDVPLPPATGDVQVLAVGYVAITRLHRGYPDEARRRRDESMRRAAGTGRRFDLVLALQLNCFLTALLRDMAALGQIADEVIALGNELGLAAIRALGNVSRGRAIAAGGDYEAGAAVMADGIEAYRASGTRVALSALLGWLTDVHVHAGNTAAAGPVLAEALAFTADTQERRYLAELRRLEGELHQLQGDRNAAEQSFRRAIDLAREHGSRWWELRATVSLARLQQRQRKSRARGEARAALAAILAGFTEGFDTADVQQAQALLTELS